MYSLAKVYVSLKKTAIHVTDTLIGYASIDSLDLLAVLMLLLISTAIVYFAPMIAVLIMTYTTHKLIQPIIREGAKNGLHEDDFVAYTNY